MKYEQGEAVLILEADDQGNVIVKETYTPEDEDRDFGEGALSSLYIKKSATKVQRLVKPLRSQYAY